MKKDEEFYVGWQEKTPKGIRKFLKLHVVLFILLIPILSIAIVYMQSGFNDHIFTFGKIEEISGIYHAKPVPILELKSNQNDDFDNYALLVGYGKFGAEGIMQSIEMKTSSLDGKQVTLKGTKIIGDGKLVFELTEKENSLVSVEDPMSLDFGTLSVKQKVELSGEILDPKCYFGVMKPGEGKLHRSCAIRCISGGIAPVFRLQEKSDNEIYNQYYLLLGENGEKINKQILQKVGIDVAISGMTNFHNGWNVLYVSPDQIKIIEQ